MNDRNCTALRRCLELAIDGLQIPDWQQANLPAPHGTAHAAAAAAAAVAESAAAKSFDLAMWFLFFYVVRHSIGHTLVMIPYDALGQELTTDGTTRQVCPCHART